MSISQDKYCGAGSAGAGAREDVVVHDDKGNEMGWDLPSETQASGPMRVTVIEVAVVQFTIARL